MATFSATVILNSNFQDLVSAFSTWRNQHENVPSNSINLTPHAAEKLIDHLTEVRLQTRFFSTKIFNRGLYACSSIGQRVILTAGCSASWCKIGTL